MTKNRQRGQAARLARVRGVGVPVMKSPQAVARRVFRFLTGSSLSMGNSSYDFPEKKELLHVAEKRRNYLIQKKKTRKQATIS